MDDEEEKKKPAMKPKPIKKLHSEDDGGFLAQLSAHLARGPAVAVQKRPANPPSHHLQTPQELIDAKLSIPRIKRTRGVTTKYDAS